MRLASSVDEEIASPAEEIASVGEEVLSSVEEIASSVGEEIASPVMDEPVIDEPVVATEDNLVVDLPAEVAPEVAPEVSLSVPDDRPTSERDDKAFADLTQLAIAANPTVKYWDPLDLVNQDFVGENQAENIAWLRHAEIKHGRVAMAAFVGYCVQSQYTWGDAFPAVSLGPEAQWDALDNEWKWSIILTVGLLEFLDEGDEKGHYLTGARDPGRHPVFQRKTGKSAEKLAEGRVKEINNGRLAMLGIMGFVSSSTISGAVPILNYFPIPSYAGNFWAPFEGVVDAVSSTVS